MGFNKVYKSLQEIFPQIDARVLRAVAIEHNKDVDAAVEIVLAEIIPFFKEKSRPRPPSTECISIGESSKDVIDITQTADSTSVNAANGKNDMMNVGNQQSFHDANDEHTEPFYDNYNGHDEERGNITALTVPGNILGDGMQTKSDVHSHVEYEGEGNSAELTLSEGVHVEYEGEAGQLISEDSAKVVSGEPKTSETDLDDKYPESSIKNACDDIPSNSLGISQDEDNDTSHNLNLSHGTGDDSHIETVFGSSTDKEGDHGNSYEDGNYAVVEPSSLTNHDSHLETEFGSSTDKEGDHGNSYEDGNYSVVEPTSLNNHGSATHSLESDPQLAVLQDKSGSGLEELDASLPESTASKIESASDTVGTQNLSTSNASMSQSSQINIINALEEIIADARNNKSVISLMREVELKEQAAEQAKVEAAMGGSDILVKSEELKEMVQQAEEANAMYSGEVYGEKAILGTELRELQSRVVSLSAERDKSLSVLDEMQQTLEVRLAESQNVIKSAEQEKIEKEKAAMKALANQELIMEKVVQESKHLKQQAEDNAKLREFLVDRGRVVDMLQGEIGVICHDVRLLKENFDERVPFSKSLSSSQTSCILASSTSSSKSLIPEQADGRVDSAEAQKERGACSSTHQSSEEEDVDPKALLDDGWELM